MRDAYHEELDSLGDDLVELAHRVGSAMERATVALIDADLAVAEQVIAADADIDALRDAIDEKAFDLLARQQPVASDLRIVFAAIRMSSDLERMGDLAAHVAKVARLRYPESAVPPELRATLLQMGQVATRIVAKAGQVIASKDIAIAVQLETDDDEMDKLHRELFTALLGDRWPHGMESAIDITLVGRYYERYADHAVAVARLVVYLVTGQYASRENAGAR